MKTGCLNGTRFLFRTFANWNSLERGRFGFLLRLGFLSQFLALGTFGCNGAAALLIARLFEMLVLAQLLRKTFFFTGLLETAQNLFQTFTCSSFDADHSLSPAFRGSNE